MSDGDLARKLAGEMIDRFPGLESNPYAILIRFVENASVGEIQGALKTIGASIVEHYPTSNWYLICLLYTSPSPRDISGSRMPSSA